MSILVIDVGTSGLRAAVIEPDASVKAERYRQLLPSSPQPGMVEFDAVAMATAAVELAHEVIAEAGPVDSVGVASQRASVVVWDRATGVPVAPGIGWQDLRTVFDCLLLRDQGVRLAPNQSATKVKFLLDEADPGRSRDLCFGTVDSWIVWTLSRGTAHVTDWTNIMLTGFYRNDASGWDTHVLDVLNIPPSVLPQIVDSSGLCAEATALPGAPPIAGLAGDQQASLVGQGCMARGLAKITFGTGGMLDLCLGPERPTFDSRGHHGGFPVVTWSRDGLAELGIEAIMLSAGTNVEWLRDDLGLLATAADSHEVASQCLTSEGVVYVPALLGLGTPYWDYGARGTLLGITRGSARPQIVRAVLEGIAQRGADLVEAAEGDSGLTIGALRIDGGMSANPTFVQALADATQRPIEVSPALEATTRGAAFLAGLATGVWADEDDIIATWKPSARVEPVHQFDREQWKDACRRAGSWIPDFSALDF